MGDQSPHFPNHKASHQVIGCIIDRFKMIEIEHDNAQTTLPFSAAFDKLLIINIKGPHIA